MLCRGSLANYLVTRPASANYRAPCLRSGGGAVSLLLLLLGCVLCPLPMLQDPLPVEAGWICRPAARCSAAAVGRGRLPRQAPHAPALRWSAACCAPALMALQADLLLLCAVVRIKHPAPPEYLQPPAQEHRTQKRESQNPTKINTN